MVFLIHCDATATSAYTPGVSDAQPLPQDTTPTAKSPAGPAGLLQMTGPPLSPCSSSGMGGRRVADGTNRWLLAVSSRAHTRRPEQLEACSKRKQLHGTAMRGAGCTGTPIDAKQAGARWRAQLLPPPPSPHLASINALLWATCGTNSTACFASARWHVIRARQASCAAVRSWPLAAGRRACSCPAGHMHGAAPAAHRAQLQPHSQARPTAHALPLTGTKLGFPGFSREVRSAALQRHHVNHSLRVSTQQSHKLMYIHSHNIISKVPPSVNVLRSTCMSTCTANGAGWLTEALPRAPARRRQLQAVATVSLPT